MLQFDESFIALLRAAQVESAKGADATDVVLDVLRISFRQILQSIHQPFAWPNKTTELLFPVK